VGTRDMREMGGLGARMPFTRTVFVIGALALAGLPILNGFWSKELVLEAGLTGGPRWAFYAMVLGAGLTACYTFRFVWMVFYGSPRKVLHPHDAPAAMRFSLTLLAFGTLTSWLLAGPFGHLLESSLPFHKIHGASTFDLVAEVLGAPATWGAMLVVGLGLLAWAGREGLSGLTGCLAWLGRAASRSFGFEWVNGLIVRATVATAGGLRITQPGVLNWNVVGIVGGLVALLVFLAWGA